MLADDDHREIGKKLDLFHFHEQAPGMVYWHPRGFALFGVLEDVIRRHLRRDEFFEVRTPQLVRLPIWQASGHLQHSGQHMFVLEAGAESSAVKPVNCPGHIELFKRAFPSYRDLPVRYAELGLVHRNEPSGTLHGLFRLRQFTQDDGHVFCEEHQVEQEIARFSRSLLELYASFGFSDLQVVFASRPDERAGSDESWDRAESLLLAAARKSGLEPELAPKSGAFYGPKLEFALADRLGRSWQCGTIQLDLVLPERFDLEYVDSSGERARPIMLHRATLGSLERFLGILLEHYSAALPAWLAPEQVSVLPVTNGDRDYAVRVLQEFSRAGIRTKLDDRSDSLSRRVLAAHERAASYTIVVGRREAERQAVSVRTGTGQRVLDLPEAIAQIVPACRPPL